MMKKYGKTLLWASLLTLLPCVYGAALIGKLPQMPGMKMNFFAMPFVLLATQWLCLFITAKDPGNQDRNEKPMKLVLWIIPALSNATALICTLLLQGSELKAQSMLQMFLGLMFLVIGNYLPKCRRNHTIGIRVFWTLADEDTWNATHRLGGRVWVIGGAAMVLSAFLPGIWSVALMFISIFVMVLIPVLYSWRYYNRKKASGGPMSGMPKELKNTKFAAAISAVILAAVAVLLLTGNLHVRYDADSFTVEADYYTDLTVRYEEISRVEFREGNISGTRTWGFGSLRLLMGTFHNEEFGTYTRYTYTSPKACVILTTDSGTVVLSGRTETESREIYETLTARTER